jgi:MFS family permease
MNNLTKLYMFKFLTSMFFVSGVLVPFFLEWGKISYLQIMLIQSWFVIWVTVLEIPTGAIADRYGRKFSIALGAFINSIAAVIYCISPNFYLFLVAEFTWAVSQALISGADVALLYDTLKEQKKSKESKKIYGKYNGYGLLAIVISAPIGSFIAAAFGLRFVPLAMSLPLVMAAVIALTLKEPRYKMKKVDYKETLLSGIRYFSKHRILKILAFDAVSVYIVSFMIVWLYQPSLLELSFPLILLGLVHSIGTVFEMLLSSNFDYLEKISRSKKNYLFFSALLLGVSFILLSISANYYLSALLVILIVGFGFTRRSLLTNYMNKHIKSHNRATVLSSISMVESIGRALMYPLVGLLAKVSISFAAFGLGCIILLASIFSRVEEKQLLD